MSKKIRLQISCEWNKKKTILDLLKKLNVSQLSSSRTKSGSFTIIFSVKDNTFKDSVNEALSKISVISKEFNG